MGRGMQIAVLAAAAVGGAGGGLAALLAASDPGRHAPDPPTTAAGFPPTTAAALPSTTPVSPGLAAPAAVASPDPRLVLATTMKTVLTRVASWAHDHAGEPCPDLGALGVVAPDPWGHPLELTCSDQPADQIVGAVSAGPDGIAGNDDDVPSWALGSEVTGLVRGARWKPPLATAAPSRSGKHRKDTAAPGAAVRRPTQPVRPSTAPATLATTPAAPVTTPAVPATAGEPATIAPAAKPSPAPDAIGDDIPARR